MLAAAAITPAFADVAREIRSGGQRATELTKKSAPTSDLQSTKKFRPLRTGAAKTGLAKPRTTAHALKGVRNYKDASGLPTLYGSVVYSFDIGNNVAEAGLYQLPTSAGKPTMLFRGPLASAGGVCIGNTYYATKFRSLWGMMFITVDVYNMETGERFNSFSPDDYATLAIGGISVDPTSGEVYGATYNSEGDAMQLTKLHYTDEGVTAEKVGDLDGAFDAIAFDSTGQLWGLSHIGQDINDEYVVTNSYLNKLDKTTGEATLIGETGLESQLLSSATIDTKTNRMFWNVCSDESSVLAEVDLTTGQAHTLFELEGAPEIMGMFVPAPAAADDAPFYCEDISINLYKDTPTGNVTLKTPSLLFDEETAGTGPLTVKVIANDTEVGSLAAEWGAEVSVPITLPETGMYTFEVYAENENGPGAKTKFRDVWVGGDTPVAPEPQLSYDGTSLNLTWDPVTVGVLGGYIDLENLSYTVTRADGTIAAEGLTETSYSEPVEAEGQLATYYYTVTVKAGDVVSGAGKSNIVAVGSIIPPYTSDFGKDGLAGWTIIDANEDGKTWEISDQEAKVTYNSTLSTDDWLISPQVKLQAGKSYTLSFNARGNSASFAEKFEVKAGAAPTVEGLTEQLVEPTELKTSDPVLFEAALNPTADGMYYIGIHGISDPDKFALLIGNLTIQEGRSLSAPGEATDVKVTPNQQGEFKATISFNAPSTTIDGNQLESLTKAEVWRGDLLVHTFDNPAPGEALSCEDATLESAGTATYKVTAYNSHGKGSEVSASAYIGYDLPMVPTNVQAFHTDKAREILITWDPVTADINGLPMDASKVTYIVAQYNDGWNAIASGISSTECLLQMESYKDTQHFEQFAVFAQNEIGYGEGAASQLVPVGKLYESISESLPHGSGLNHIWSYDTSGGASWDIRTDLSFEGLASQDGDNGYFGMRGFGKENYASLCSGMVNLRNLEKPGLSFYTFNITDENGTVDDNLLEVDVMKLGDREWTNIYSKSVNEACGGETGWGYISIPLDDYADNTILFRFTGYTKVYTVVAIDNIKLNNMPDYDLQAGGLIAPAKVKAGDDFKVEASVYNPGTKESGAYTVELYENGKLIDSHECASLASGASASTEFECHMPGIAVESVEYYTRIIVANDEDETNNISGTTTIRPLATHLPAVAELSGESGDETVILSWNEPDVYGEDGTPVTDDFEDGESFSDNYREWTFVDLDEATVGGYQNIEIPNVVSMETKGSYWVWDQDEVDISTTFNARSGKKYLFSLFNLAGFGIDAPVNNDWAISPELYGNAQTVTFYAKSYNASKLESIKVYYSTTGNDPADFTLVEGYEECIVPGTWHLYEAALPEGAKYFAIVHDSKDRSMLMVDDVTYIPALRPNRDLILTGYNVYRDGLQITPAPITETEYTDMEVTLGQSYHYVVTAVYNNGESAASNEVDVTPSGVNGIATEALSVTTAKGHIIIRNAQGISVNVAAANGSVIYSGEGEQYISVAAAPGVYVVTAGSATAKVIVK